MEQEENKCKKRKSPKVSDENKNPKHARKEKVSTIKNSKKAPAKKGTDKNILRL